MNPFKVGDLIEVRYSRNDSNIESKKAKVIRTLDAQVYYHPIDKENDSWYVDYKFCSIYEEERKIENCNRCHDNITGVLYKNEEGKFYCSHCYQISYSYCSLCRKEKRTSELNNIGRLTVCDTCLREEFTMCPVGDEYCRNREFDGDAEMCESCLENQNEEGENEDSERKYSKDDSYATEKGRKYAVELETNFRNYQDRKELFNLPKEVGITRDGSLGSRGVELQTPKLNGDKGDKLLRTVCQHLSQNGFKVDEACGLHIHLDTADFFKVNRKKIEEVSSSRFRYWVGESASAFMSQEQLTKRQEKEKRDTYNAIKKQTILNRIKNLMLFYLVFEPVIYSFMPMSRRVNRYCFPLNEFYHWKEILEVRHLDEFEKIWYREQRKVNIKARKKEKYDSSRYAGFNFHSMLANHHIECRHHSGTQDYNKIKNWVDLNVLILDMVVENRISITKLEEVKGILELSQKTKIFFEMLNVNKDMQTYFIARQKKFCEGTKDQQLKCVE